MSAELKLVDDLSTPESDVHIHNCEPNNLLLWTAARPYLLRALEHTDEWDIDDVMQGYCAGQLGILLCVRDNCVFGALCVEMTDYPKKRVLQVHLFGADDHSEADWLNYIWPQLLGLARQGGAVSVIGTGRPGWARKLAAKKRILWEVAL